MTTKPFTVLS